MSNWVGGLPPEPTAKVEKKEKKAAEPASPPDGDHPRMFFGGAIPPVPPKLPKYKKEEPPPQVKITGAGIPIEKDEPKPKAPSQTPAATPPAPPPPTPPPPPPSPVSEPTPQSYTPRPPPFAVFEPTPQSYAPPPLPRRFPSVFDKKPKKKRKKKKKKPKPPPPPPPKPLECDEGVCDDQGEEDLGKLRSIFAICHIPATRQGQYSDSLHVIEKEDRSGFASPRSGGGDDDDGPDIPPEVPRYMRPDQFSNIFGKKIDARNIAETGPHGWHESANAPYDITDTGDTVTVGPSGWHEPRSE